MAYRFRKPIIGVNHIEGHIYSNWLANKKIEFPALILTVSGGHTELVLMSAKGGSASGGKNSIRYKIIGRTLDDAAGEAFDKAARLLGLGFPGGPAIAAEAEKLSPFGESPAGGKISLPRPMINSKDFNFSFSGLKTAVLYLYSDLIKKYLPEEIKPAFAAEVQDAIVDVLTSKTIKAVEKFNPKTIMVAGGVSANKKLRETMAEKAAPYGIPLLIPDFAYTTDNAAMIAAAGYFNYLKKKPTANAWKKLEANANLEL
ncbi:MAG: tRNA (adenosine(37)-N6)-threonylcarbamoyltransferase complex transferase subunit TsaD [Patescibacteria group bacterium]